MSDTPPDVARKYRDMLLERSGEERLKIGCSMHATAQALVRASVLEKDPLASRAALQRALFLRFYGREFSAELRAKILSCLVAVDREEHPTATESGGAPEGA